MKKKFSELDERERLDILPAMEHVSAFNLLIFLNNQETPLSFDSIIKEHDISQEVCSIRLNSLLQVNLVDHDYPNGYHITDLGRDVLRELLEVKNISSHTTNDEVDREIGSKEVN